MSRITLINHATTLIELGEVNVLTDPTYAHSVGLVAPRLQKPGIPFDELPHIDLVLISHADYDHLHLRTLRRLRRKDQPVICLPRGEEHFGKRAGMTRIVGMSWWEEATIEGVRITCVPAKHGAHRRPFSRRKALCCGYVVERDGVAVYFAGDTGYGAHFGEIGSRFTLHAALLPIGAYKPSSWFRDIHLHPHSAVKAFVDSRADVLIPIHWGTFKISDEPVLEPPELLREEAAALNLADRVHILQNGECRELPDRR